MAITTIDGALAGMQIPVNFFKTGATMAAIGRMHSYFFTAGAPGAAVISTAGTGGEALTSYSGQIPFTNPGAGNSYLAKFEAAASTAGTLWLMDRLWHNNGLSVTSTSLQTVNSVTLPARDNAGSTNGAGVFAAFEVSTVLGAGTPTQTLVYTDSGNTGSNSVTITLATTQAAGTFLPFPLAVGDLGVKSIQSITGSATMTSGAYSLVLYRPLACVSVNLAGISGAIDAISGGFPRLYDDTVPFLVWLPSVTTATNVFGRMVVTQG